MGSAYASSSNESQVKMENITILEENNGTRKVQCVDDSGNVAVAVYDKKTSELSVTSNGKDVYEINLNDYEDSQSISMSTLSSSKIQTPSLNDEMQMTRSWILIGENASYWWNYYWACYENDYVYFWQYWNGSGWPRAAWEDEGNNQQNLFGFGNAVNSMKSHQMSFILASLISITSGIISIISTGGTSAVVIAALVAVGVGATAAQIGFDIVEDKANADFYYARIVQA